MKLYILSWGRIIERSIQPSLLRLHDDPSQAGFQVLFGNIQVRNTNIMMESSGFDDRSFLVAPW